MLIILKLEKGRILILKYVNESFVKKICKYLNDNKHKLHFNEFMLDFYS